MIVLAVTMSVTSACGSTDGATPATTVGPRSTGSSTAGTLAAAVATSSPSTTIAETTTTLPLSDEAQIRALLDTYWSEWLLAGDPPDPHRASFTQLLTGDSLQREVEALEKRLALGEARRLPPSSRFAHTTRSVTVTGDHGIANECVVDDSVLLEIHGGAILNDEVATYELEETLLRVNGQWLLESSSIKNEREGVQSCAA